MGEEKQNLTRYIIHWKLVFNKAKGNKMDIRAEGVWHCEAMSEKQARKMFRNAHANRVCITEGARDGNWYDYSKGIYVISSNKEQDAT